MLIMQKKCFSLHPNHYVKIVVFKTFFSSFYASHTWSTYKLFSRQHFKTAYNRIFILLFYIDKRASISQSMIYHNINAHDVMLRKYSYSFKNRLYSSENKIVKILVNSLYFYGSSLFQRWTNELYCM